MPVICNVDIETYSEVELKEVGAYRYAEHPSTCALCASWKFDDSETVYRWRPGDPAPTFAPGTIFEGYNVTHFDALIWQKILTPRHGWVFPGFERFSDTMARVALTNLPGSLAQAARAMGTAEKDVVGSKLMTLLCRPANATIVNADPKRRHSPEALARLEEYCDDDVRAEAALSRAVPALPEAERPVLWASDQMNRRGVRVDLDLVERMQGVAAAYQEILREQLVTITRGQVESETKLNDIKAFCRARGLAVKDGPGALDKDAINGFLELADLESDVRRVLQIRQWLGKSSLAKLSRLKAATCADGRVRGLFMFCGAHQTARWSGKIVQPQNLPKGVLKGARAYEEALAAIYEGADSVDLFYGDKTMDILASCIRCCLVPTMGNEFVVADYSAIEARVVAWLAGEQWLLDAFRQGIDPYKVMTSVIYGVPYEAVTPAQRQVGKTVVLGAGFGLGHKKFVSYAAKAGIVVETEEAKRIIDAYRTKNSRIKGLWYECDRAAKTAIRNPGTIYAAGKLLFKFDGQNLKMRLPSGRCLWYRKAYLATKAVPWSDEPQEAIFFYGEDEHGNWGAQDTYGGKLVENATQAAARDVLAHAMVKVEGEGLSPVITIHDELGCDLPPGRLSVRDLEALMCDLPAWADGLPMKAEGFTCNRYRKN